MNSTKQTGARFFFWIGDIVKWQHDCLSSLSVPTDPILTPLNRVLFYCMVVFWTPFNSQVPENPVMGQIWLRDCSIESLVLYGSTWSFWQPQQGLISYCSEEHPKFHLMLAPMTMTWQFSSPSSSMTQKFPAFIRLSFVTIRTIQRMLMLLCHVFMLSYPPKASGS